LNDNASQLNQKQALGHTGYTSVAVQTATADIVVFNNDEDDEDQSMDNNPNRKIQFTGGPQMPQKVESPIKKGARVRIYQGHEII